MKFCSVRKLIVAMDNMNVGVEEVKAIRARHFKLLYSSSMASVQSLSCSEKAEKS